LTLRQYCPRIGRCLRAIRGSAAVGPQLPGTIQLALHTVTQGRAWLWLEDPRDAVELVSGDLALVMGGPDHHIAHDRDAACQSPDRFGDPDHARRRIDPDSASAVGNLSQSRRNR
jgi:Cupin